MNAARYPLRAVTLRHAIVLDPKFILLSLTFLGCLLVVSILTIHEAYGFAELLEESAFSISIREQAVALGAMLATIFGVVTVYMRKLSP